MRHQNKGRKLNRTSSHRRALFKNMALALLTNEQIFTTLPKAKELRSYVEKLVTLGKRGTLHARRQIISQIQSVSLAEKLIDSFATRYKTRDGGYTRVLKAGFRHGDNAPIAIIEMVDRPLPEAAPAAKEDVIDAKAEDAKAAPAA